MNRFKRPQLSLSDLKVPPVLRDLYWDLRDRRLLPLVALVLVAILALPFLLGGGDGGPESTLAPLAPDTAKESASLTVLPAAPGLREPSKRLAGRAAKNPFRQHYTGPVLRPGAAPLPENAGAAPPPSGSSGDEIPSAGGGSPVETDPAPEPAPVAPGGGNGNSGGSEPPGPGEVQLYTFAIDVKVAHTEVTEGGAKKMGAPVTIKEVEPATSLPGKKTPVLTYLNVDMKGKKALLLVSTEVTALYGDNKCAAGTGTCQLLALEEGVPEVVEYGDNAARYKFELLKIEPIAGPTIKAPKE
jgi:hypothetical protein